MDYDSSTGSIFCLASDGTSIFAGTYSGGVLVSTDDGRNWTVADSGLHAYGYPQCFGVSSIAVAGTNVFAGTMGGGIFRSTDNGTVWIPVNSGLPDLTGTSIHALAVNSGPGTEGGTSILSAIFPLADYSGAVFLSSNNGTNWSAVTPIGSPWVGALAVSQNGATGTDLFAATYGDGVLRSTNAGDSWTDASGNICGSGLCPEIHSLAISGARLFAGTVKGIFVSSNNGTSWSDASSGLGFPSAFSIAVSGTSLFAGTGDANSRHGAVFLSTDNGASWQDVSWGLPNGFILSLLVNGTDLYAGTVSYGIWKRPLSEMMTAVSSGMDLQRSFSLSQNYPNPFNPITTLSFTLPTRLFVSLRVFDVCGRLKATIFSQELPAGTHIRQWNAGRLSSGVYFLRLQAGPFAATRTLQLLK